MMIPNTKRHSLHGGVTKHIESGSTVYTDALRSYDELDREYIHYAEKYVDGQIRTNGVEDFWNSLEQTLEGTIYQRRTVPPFRYLDEQSFRFNNRKLTDGRRST
jgi:transposase-like protein